MLNRKHYLHETEPPRPTPTTSTPRGRPLTACQRCSKKKKACVPVVDDESGNVLGCQRCLANRLSYCTLIETCERCKSDGEVCKPVVSSVTNQRIGCERCITSKLRDCSLYQKCERCEYSGEECVPFFPYDALHWANPRFLIACRTCCKEDCYTSCTVSECYEELYKFQEEYPDLYGDREPDWSLSERTPPCIDVECDENGAPIDRQGTEVETPTVVDFTGTTLTLASGNMFEAEPMDDHVSIGVTDANVEANSYDQRLAFTTDDHVSIGGSDAIVKAPLPSLAKPPARVLGSQQSAVTSSQFNAFLHPYDESDLEPDDSVCDSLSDKDYDGDSDHFEPSDHIGPSGGVKTSVDLDLTLNTMTFAETSCSGDANLFVLEDPRKPVLTRHSISRRVLYQHDYPHSVFLENRTMPSHSINEHCRGVVFVYRLAADSVDSWRFGIIQSIQYLVPHIDGTLEDAVFTLFEWVKPSPVNDDGYPKFFFAHDWDEVSPYFEKRVLVAGDHLEEGLFVNLVMGPWYNGCQGGRCVNDSDQAIQSSPDGPDRFKPLCPKGDLLESEHKRSEVHLPSDVRDIFARSKNGEYIFNYFESNKKAPAFQDNSFSKQWYFFKYCRMDRTVPLNICVVDGKPDQDPKDTINDMRKQSKDLRNHFIISDIVLDRSLPDCSTLPFYVVNRINLKNIKNDLHGKTFSIANVEQAVRSAVSAFFFC